jgi:hypothetical protein
MIATGKLRFFTNYYTTTMGAPQVITLHTYLYARANRENSILRPFCSIALVISIIYIYYMTFLFSTTLQAISVIVDGVTTPLTLHMGNATIGTYSVDANAPLAGSGCQLYYFQVTTGTGEFYGIFFEDHERCCWCVFCWSKSQCRQKITTGWLIVMRLMF